MLTRLDGSRINVTERYPNKGIFRGLGSQCTEVRSSSIRSLYYQCKNIAYRMLIIQSLDADTETRRVSPVAVASGGYIDLINGPQDHGWCHGYTCQERISTFNAIVATGKDYEIFFTSYNPQKTRLHLLNSDEADYIRVQIFYAKPQRLDIYIKGNNESAYILLVHVCLFKQVLLSSIQVIYDVFVLNWRVLVTMYVYDVYKQALKE